MYVAMNVNKLVQYQAIADYKKYKFWSMGSVWFYQLSQETEKPN